jgi:hypothetical protein
MPRRPLSRVQKIAVALELVERARPHLVGIDLRSTSGELREELRRSRLLVDDLGETLVRALKADVPPRVTQQRRAGRAPATDAE